MEERINIDKPLSSLLVTSNNPSKPPLTTYKAQEWDKIIRFRSLNRDRNFIFLRDKNKIQILEPIKLIVIYSFHHNDLIEDFAIEPKKSSLIICTNSFLEIYCLLCSNLSDYELKIKFELHKSIPCENVRNISVSSLGDCIVVLNKHRGIKIYDIELNLIKNLSINIEVISKDQELFPLDVFQLTYDTRTIICCKYNQSNLSFIYKRKNVSEEDNLGEYSERIISFKEDILYLKEYQKSFGQYIDYQDSSIFFILTTGLNFLIMKKIYEINQETYDYIPNTMILMYIDLSSQTETQAFSSISFSLLYDNENPIFKGQQTLPNNIQSGIINIDNWNLSLNKNTLSDNELNTFLAYNSFYLKTVSCDYIIFNFNENIVMYQINGLQSPPFNNPTVESIDYITQDNNYDSSFVLLKITKTLDKNYSMFFIDKYSTLRKYIVKTGTSKTNGSSSNINAFKRNQRSQVSDVMIIDSKRAFTIFRNIVYAEYNDKIRKTFVYEIQDNDSLISIFNSKLDFSKMIILQKEVINKIHWLKDSNFLIFSYLHSRRIPVIAIVHVYSKYLDKTINMITNDGLITKHIYINPSEMFQIDINRIFDVVIESPYVINNIIDKKSAKEKRGYNDIKTDLLIKTNESLMYLNLNVEMNPKTNETKEFIFFLTKKWECNKTKIVEKDQWESKAFAFNSNKVYYFDRDLELKIFNVRQIDDNGEIRTVFQTVIFQDLLHATLTFNNYVIFITNHYINSYDIVNKTFYRIRNDYVVRDAKTKELNMSISVFKCGIYICLLLLNETGIKLLRIPRNKNKNEQFSYVFDYKFTIGKQFSQVTLENGMVIFNETQMEKLSEISQIQHKLLFKLKEEELLLLNSNANSLFDCETFLDFFLSDSEEIIKLILNIFCNLYSTNHQNFTDAYKNSKLIPNLFELNSINYIIKIIFENDLNVLSMIGGPSSSRKGSINSSQDKLVGKIQIDNAKLKFKSEEDDQEENPISRYCSKFTNLTHLKYIYDLISSESTRNMDNLTKYFILKMKSKKEDFQSMHFKMSTADLCWLFLITNQEYILKFISDDQVKSINWDMMTMFNIPIWLKNDVKLKELLENVGRNEYKKLLKDNIDPLIPNKTQERNFTEKIALYFYLADKEKLIIDFIDREPQNEKIKKFIQRDFKITKNRLIAKENADLLVNKKKYLFAAYFYLLADDIRSALDMTLEKLKDINLTICLLRLVKSRYGNDSWTKYYSLDKIYQDFFINFGTVIRDPWLVVYGYLGQNKIDLALEYMLNYDIEYTFDKNQQIFENMDEYNSNLEIILKIFAVNVFDYKILIFAKNLEKLYLTIFEERINQVKNVGNTNFEDLWDMDGDEEDNNNSNTLQTNSESKKGLLKELDIEYKNLSKLCVINSLKRGILYAPILNLYKMTFNDSYEYLSPSQKEIIKCLISDRIILDSLFTYNKPSVEKYFRETESLFTYLENNKIVKKKDLHDQLITGFLKLDEYQSAHIPCFASNKIRETLIWLSNYIEKLMNRNIYILSNFNFNENVNLNKIVENLHKFLQVSFFLVTVLSYTEKEKDILSSFINKREKNLYIFRIILMMLFYLLFVSKLIMKYSLITGIFERIESLAEEHKKIEDYNESIANKDIAMIINLCNKLSSRIFKEISGEKKIYKDEGISFFIQFLNYAIITEANQLLYNNKHLELNRIKSAIKGENTLEDHYVHEEFKFINQFSSLMKSYIDNFDTNMEKYIKNYMTSDLIIDIHKELKNIYMTNSIPSKLKYRIIKINTLFKKTEILQSFESKFKIRSIVMKYISLLCKQFKYIPKSNQIEDSENINYTQKSITHIQEIFSKGFDIATFPEGTIIQDFSINACNISNFAISLFGLGHKKINILNSLLVSKRSEDFHQLNETIEENLDEIYKANAHRNYNDIIDDLLQKKYNELLVFINHDLILKNSNANNFQSHIILPPEMFNEIPSEKYEEDISMNDINSNSYCKIIESHPQLPLYLTSNNRGIISLWSYHYDSKKSIDEFCIEKITKDNMMKSNANLTRMKFNYYGNEFLACDQEGSLFVWSFEHIKSLKLPKTSLLKTERLYCKDACFLNNTGIIGSTSNKTINGHNTTLWDLLLPLNQCNIGQINVGGNFIVPISSDATFAVFNNTPGSVHLVDIRKMEVVKEFKAHFNEIKAVKLSAKEKFLVTMGKDSLVKIWDMSNKIEPSLIESFEAFPPSKDDTKSRLHLNIAHEYLFASKDNCIKLLRNKLS